MHGYTTRDGWLIGRHGRQTGAWGGPWVRHAAGRPVRMSSEGGAFELELDCDPSVDAPTEVFLPVARRVTASHGEVSRVGTLLYWDTGDHAGAATLRAEP